MKKSTAWILVIIIIVLIGLAWYAFSNNNTSQQVSTITTSTTQSSGGVTAVDYFCATGTIDAVYGSSSVDLALSDGRTMTLAQSVSGSGIRYESASGTTPDVVFSSKGNNASLTENGKTTFNSCVAGKETPSTSGMMTFTDGTNLFSFTYPDQFTISGGDVGYTQNWRVEATSSGMELAVVTIPQSFQPKTNFVGATFTVGVSSDPSAVSSCLTASNGMPTTSATTTINGVSFAKLTYSDAGAGNIYNTTSYRTVRDSECYAIEYTVHSSQLGNYPPSAGITAFSSSTVNSTLDSMARSFIFLQ